MKKDKRIPTEGVNKLFDIQRRVVSYMVSNSWKNVPHVTYLYEPDITEFYGQFEVIADHNKNISTRPTFNTLMLRTIIEGLRAAPKLNAFIKYNHQKGEGSLLICDDINISIPWLLEDGRMITPVICRAQRMTLYELSSEVLNLQKKIKNTNIDELLYRAVCADTKTELKNLHLGVLKRVIAAKIRIHSIHGLSGNEKRAYNHISEESRLTEQNLISGTVTVSNIGSLYKAQRGHFGLLEIIPPQIFAVGLGAVQEKAGVYQNAAGQKVIGIRKTIPICLAFDHRAVDFASLIPFLKRLDEIFENPSEIRRW